MMIYIGGWPRKDAITWSGQYGNIGSLFSPGQRITDKLPYCLDNGAFVNFNPRKFIHHIEKGASIGKPDFIVCPDAIGDSEETLRRWKEWHPCLREFGCPIAYCCQDGQSPSLVPSSADLLFLGGSTRYKLQSLRWWSKRFHTHVGRVNTWSRLWLCQDAGARSVDGTGWFRKTSEHWSARDLLLFLKIQKGEITPNFQYPSWPFVSLPVRKSLLVNQWILSEEPLFRGMSV